MQDRENSQFAERKLSLLEPFGYQDGNVFPVIHAAAQKRFPALKKLVSRLAGKIDDAALQRIEEDLAKGANLRDVAKKFLI